MVEDGAAAGASEPISMLTGGSKPVHRFLKGQPKCIGIVLVMMGVCLVMFGIATDFQSDLFTSDELWCPFWLGTLFFISGLLYILSERNPSKKMITASLALSIISTIGAFCACVEFAKTISGINYIYWSHLKQNQTEERRDVMQHYMTIEKMERVFFCHSVIGGILLVIMTSFARAALRSSRTQAVVVMRNLPSAD